jgi:hypothetical protein
MLSPGIFQKTLIDCLIPQVPVSAENATGIIWRAPDISAGWTADFLQDEERVGSKVSLIQAAYTDLYLCRSFFILSRDHHDSGYKTRTGESCFF